MNEYTIYFLNGIEVHKLAGDWKDAILEGRLHAERHKFSPKIKYIVDEDSKVIKHINEDDLTYTPGFLNDIIKVI